MNIEEFREYCLAKPGVTEETPFGPDTLVFKVMAKMFALTGIDSYDFINLKCDPERSAQLRAEYDSIRPGYHMNKALWNSVYTDGSVPNSLLADLIDHSYDLIVASLRKKDRDALKNLS